MFVGAQIFPCSWGLNFVGTCSRLGIILVNIKQMLLYTFAKYKFVGKGFQRKPRTFAPTNNDESKVLQEHIFLKIRSHIKIFLKTKYFLTNAFSTFINC